MAVGWRETDRRAIDHAFVSTSPQTSDDDDDDDDDRHTDDDGDGVIIVAWAPLWLPFRRRNAASRRVG